MSKTSQSEVADVREATRKLVREFDVFRNIKPSLDVSLSQCHALIEIQKNGSITMVELTRTLGLNKSSVSRILTSLNDSGYICQQENPEDSRVKPYVLTDEGIAKLACIDDHTAERVSHALDLLDADAKAKVIEGMTLYAEALRQTRMDE